MWDGYRDRSQPPHIGVLLDNTPEYLFWLGAAAISRSAIVGINATYRGAELARLIDHCDCQVLVTSDTYTDVLADAPSSVKSDRVFATHTDQYAGLLEAADVDRTWEPADEDDGFLLIFTSGSTGFPKAVRCTQGRYTTTGRRGARLRASVPAKPCTRRCPMFHSARCSPVSPPLKARCHSEPAASSRRRARWPTSAGWKQRCWRTPARSSTTFSPRRRHRTTRWPLAALGNEASEADIRAFPERYQCTVRDSYGSTEGIVFIRHELVDAPNDALGTADDELRHCLRPKVGEYPLRADRSRRPPPERRGGGRRDREHSPRTTFEGYYNNEEARARRRCAGGIYWSGDLAYRDEDGWFYFAGRSNEWLRVDSENFAAAPVERIVARHPHVRSVAVYAVPDERVGDRVMVAVEVDDRDALRRRGVRRVPRARSPISGRSGCRASCASPASFPKLASMKLDKTSLRREAWRAPDTWWRPARGERLRRMSSADIESQAHLLP